MYPIGLAFAVVGLALTGMYLGSSLVGLVAISLAALSLAQASQGSFFGHNLMSGSVANQVEIVKASSETDSTNNKKRYYYWMKWMHPRQYDRIEMEYSSLNNHFDSGSCKAYYNSGPKEMKTFVKAGTEVNGKRTLVIYDKPSPGVPNPYVEYVEIVLYYYPSDDPTIKAMELPKFRKLGQDVQFYYVKNGVRTKIEKNAQTSPKWSTEPASFV